MNDDLKTFRFQITKYTVIITVIIAVCSVPVLGVDVPFLGGLLAGMLVSIGSFIILFAISAMVLTSGNKWMASFGYLMRLPVYGLVFYIVMKTGGLLAGIACLIGFLTTNFSMIYVHGIKAKFSAGSKKEE